MTEAVISHGRLPLLCFLIGFIVAFVFIRISVRLIRAKVRWWPGNLELGGHHVHHAVVGIVTMLVCGVALIAVFESGSTTTGAALAGGFGIGAGLVLDEFALIFYLRDVYWSVQGRASVDAVFVAIAVTGLLLIGLHPLALLDVAGFRADDLWSRGVVVIWSLTHLVLAGLVLAKGKIWTGLAGMFFLPLLVVGAVRISRPGAPWARWRYTTRPARMRRALAREKNLRRPLIQAKIWVQDLIAGRPDLDHVREAAEQELARTVRAAPPPPAGESGPVD
ncbi:hypothetical protein KV203_12140 [Skermania piniformis]|uniref:Integral membrane protein n=1 Tax=Skermania pinensis TaxID=39122 RepID=A0ABX8SD75_9ACTN|nr:hypothetical protein KV203_12140 [Skermania piniformis]